jgi:hypothetical protein
MFRSHQAHHDNAGDQQEAPNRGVETISSHGDNSM